MLNNSRIGRSKDYCLCNWWWKKLEFPKRKSNRLKGYDYEIDGGYFITICVKDSDEILWKNDVGACFARPFETSVLSDIGLIIDNEINTISAI